MTSLIVRSKRVLTHEGERAASIHVANGRIAAVGSYDDVSDGSPTYDAGDLVVMPGIVDTHVHINEPGRTEWEGFSTATHAAAAGGITTLVEMPLNSIPATTNLSAYEEKLAAAEGQLSVDVGFWGGVVPGNAQALEPLWNAGAFGFKCFLVPSGVREFEAVSESDLREALPVLARLGAPLLVHAEHPGRIEEASTHLARNAPPRVYATWLASRPRQAEDDAVALMLELARKYGARIHIVHLSSSDSLDLLRDRKEAGVRVTVETCPHYLSFCAEAIAAGATQFKCAPPIREAENREKLWDALNDRTIDFIATDHSPCPPEMKLVSDGDFLRAWGGISSLQIALAAVWTQARARGYPISHLSDWLCAGPARLAGLWGKKGAIAPGFDADFAIWNPDSSFRVDPDKLHHRHKLTPYAGLELNGTVEATFLRGTKVFEAGQFAPEGSGQVLRRGFA